MEYGSGEESFFRGKGRVCLILINMYELHENTTDCWKWNGKYSTKTTYEYLILNEEFGEMEENHGAEFTLAWNKIAPYKVTATSWRIQSCGYILESTLG